ncbi:sigma-54-dependent Fis family transcriptional regulator [Rhodococcus wratislaviensis]|uniref:sigma-54-dependent Fis family transcriptional regulator n=1 Tax=Rhodococcus wratislaviensis TaxID=44752 RepID=UPI0035184E72
MIDAYCDRPAEKDPGSCMVRNEILESWRRSKLSGVDPDHVRSVEGDVSLDRRITRTAIPVLTSTAEALVGANTSLLLSAPDGTLLWRWDDDGRLKKRLDRRNVFIGTRMSEDVVGTNGIGTALETARAVTINGVEHFSEALRDFTCAGSPIRHPVTNRVTGVLSVTSLVEDASPLMAPTLLRLARDIQDELYGESTMHERQMLRHFLAERRRTRSSVVALSADVVIANAIATAMDLDHSALWQRIQDAPHDIIGVEIAPGTLVTVCRPVHRGGNLVGVVVVAEQTPSVEGAGVSAKRARDGARVPLPRERPWPRLLSDLRAIANNTDRLLVVGEDGVGKRTALRAAANDSDRGYREIDCVTVEEIGREGWLCQARALVEHSEELVVFAHLDGLDQSTCRALAAILDRADRGTDANLQIAATLSATAHQGGALPRVILDQFPPHIFEVPPLRKRTDDALARLVDQGLGMPALSREVIQMIQRHPWPGNHRQLEAFRRWMARQGRPTIVASDLPILWRNELIRGHLTTMQSAEYDAIAAALREHAGNKAATATALGISRSSLYRKMREYCIR